MPSPIGLDFFQKNEIEILKMISQTEFNYEILVCLYDFLIKVF